MMNSAKLSIYGTKSDRWIRYSQAQVKVLVMSGRSSLKSRNRFSLSWGLPVKDSEHYFTTKLAEYTYYNV